MAIRLSLHQLETCRSNPVRGPTGRLRTQETGTNRVLPPAMALDFASSYLLSKARLSLAEQEMERMKDKASSAELLGQLADVLKRGNDGEKKGGVIIEEN